MNNCYFMYMMQGMQFCKYVGIKCPYIGNQAVMTMKVGKMEEQGQVTLCNLNAYEGNKEIELDDSELEQLLHEMEDER